MSRIGQLNELKALREDVEALKRQTLDMARALAALANDSTARLEAPEAKRGPGRPRNDERIPAGSN